MPLIPSYAQAVTKLLKATNQSNPLQRTSIPNRTTYIRPGDILIHKYFWQEVDVYPYYRISLVVKNQLGTISYLSTRNNLLLSTFRLNDLYPPIFALILKELYKNRRLCTYDKVTEALKAIVGKSNYRTYKLEKMEDLSSLEVIKQKLPDMEELE